MTENERLTNLRNHLKDILREESVSSLAEEDFLKVLGEFKKEDLEYALKRGFVDKNKDGRLQPCPELMLKKLVADVEEGEPEPTAKKELSPEEKELKKGEVKKELPPKFDGPGEYYQLIHDTLGMCLVREEMPVAEWDKLVKPNGLAFFENFWFLHDEVPLRSIKQDRNSGQQYAVEIPRLRYYKSHRGAWFPTGKVSFVCMLERDKDPLVQQVMRVPASIVNLKEEGPAPDGMSV